MSAKILFVGDIHLGRRPGGLPGNLGEHGLTVSDLTPAAAWRTLVDWAVTHEVDAVVLAGDVVESDNARFEAYGRLREGAERLLQGGVEILAVAGNHDVTALPRLADQIPGFRLIGRDGRWEAVSLRRDGADVAWLLGWSFPTERFGSSPVASSPLPELPASGLPRIGVLHADLDAGTGPHAPVASAELERIGAEAWLLGHVHKPSALSTDRPIGYLGSLVGLDPTETGAHGPWLMEIDSGGKWNLEQVPLAPLRWEEVEVSVAELTAPHEMLGAVAAGIDRLHGRLSRSSEYVKAVGVRVRLVGTTRFHRELRAELGRDHGDRYERTLDGVLYFVQKVIDRSRPALELESIARHDHPPGLLARRLISLQSEDAAAAGLLRRARHDLAAVARESHWASLDAAEPDEATLREWLIDAGMQALEEMLAQPAGKSGPEPGP